MNRLIFLLTILFTLFAARLHAGRYHAVVRSPEFPAPAFTAAVPDTARGGNTGRVKRKKHRLTMQQLDSLRREMRRRAQAGELLQWGDSLAGINKDTADSLILERRQILLKKGDRKLSELSDRVTARYYGAKVDTAYIRRPSELWTISSHGIVSGSLIGMRGHDSGIPFSGIWTSRLRGTLSIMASCHGIGAGITVNPLKLMGRSTSTTLNINSYGNCVGFSLSYQYARTDRGNIVYGGERVVLPQDALRRREFAGSVYWAANGRKFSIPAALTQTYIQRRSAGSLLIGAAAEAGSITINAEGLAAGSSHKLTYIDLAVGLGYGYNLVISRRWLAHLSALPYIVVYDHDKLENDGTVSRMKYHFPNVMGKGTFDLQYSHRGRFVGFNSVLNGYWKGNDSRLSVFSLRWRTAVYYGLRF